jgi:hypothetical protein
MAQQPSDPDDLRKWLEGGDIAGLLEATTKGEVVVFVSVRLVFLNSLIVPDAALPGECEEALWNWPQGIHHSFSYGYGYKDGQPEHFTQPPMHDSGPVYGQSRQLLFDRDFDGVEGGRYLEIEQQFAHLMDLHWVPRRVGMVPLGRARPS